MITHPLLYEALRLEIAVLDSVEAIGCVHHCETQSGPVEIVVPPEAAYFDPATDLIWIEISPERLPRPRTCQDLVAAGLTEEVARRYGAPVFAYLRADRLVLAAQARPTTQPVTEMSATP